MTPRPPLAHGEPWARPGQAGAGALPRGPSRHVSEAFPADELWAEIFVVVIDQVISSDFSETRGRPAYFCLSWLVLGRKLFDFEYSENVGNSA